MTPGRAAQILGVVLAAWAAGPVFAFEINGRRWSSMPIPYYLNPGDCLPLESGETFADLVEQSMNSWSAVPCAEVSFQILGTTTATWAADGQNTFFCIAQDWGFGPDSAGATLSIPTGPSDPMETDVAINADTLIWVPGGPDAMQTGMIDPRSVITHELGHFLGLAHTPDPFGTMYYGHLPNGLQTTLAADDQAGICSIYPNGTTECAIEADCGPMQTCETIQGIPVCADIHDGPGSFCSKDYIDCDGMCWVSFFECRQVCLFVALDYTDGYCAPLCNNEECPPGFVCTYFPSYDVNLCLIDSSASDGGTDGEDQGPVDAENEEYPPADDGGVPPEDRPGNDEGDPTDGSGCGCSGGLGHPTRLALMVLALAAIWRRGASPEERRT